MPTRKTRELLDPNTGHTPALTASERRSLPVSLSREARRTLKQTASRLGLSSSNVIEALLMRHAARLTNGLPAQVPKGGKSPALLRQPITFLRSRSPEEVTDRLAAFADKYKQDWHAWIELYKGRSCTDIEVLVRFKKILGKWQAARPRALASIDEGSQGTVSMRGLARRVKPLLHEIEGLTLRGFHDVTARQQLVLVKLWALFRDSLAQDAQTGAVGITKAVMLLTAGALGPALDRRVREELGIEAPATGAVWLTTLHAVAEDLNAFEAKHSVRLEDLVEHRHRPMLVGRAYDMAAGPRPA